MKDIKTMWTTVLLIVIAVPCLSAPTLRNMRIQCDYQAADGIYKANHVMTAKYLFSKKLMETTRIYFEKVLKVTSEDMLTLVETAIQGQSFSIPGKTDPIDLYVYINAINVPATSAFATAYYVTNDATTNRPVSGVYDLNLAHVEDTVPNSVLYFSTFCHEFLHILGFHDGLYSQFKKNGSLIPPNNVFLDGNYYGANRKIMVLQELLTFARTYFNEPGLTGVPIEDGGGSGSAGAHWEKGLLPNEFMNPSVELPGILSQFSFKLLEATGWYTVDYDYVQDYTWGKGVTGHFSGVCPTTVGEYCPTLEEAGCSHDFMSKAKCNSETTFSTCQYWANNGKFCTIDAPEMMADDKEQYGPNSRCVMWGNIPRCHPVSCTGNVVTVKVKVNNVLTDFACSGDGAVISAGGASFTCPSSQANFCARLDATKRCPDDCNGRGFCMGVNTARICVCKYGYSGTKCETSTGEDILKLGDTTTKKAGDTLVSTVTVLLGMMALIVIV